ncbi:hypothetical protein [Burkholderia cenocepacia]|uniref:hypothetical protein n=1 Tax=Burkholderia cenocepacia TaxID=95486 RepID=UPI00209B39D1|nr:hypothetical protein [Burkholderia cenocepacia]
MEAVFTCLKSTFAAGFLSSVTVSVVPVARRFDVRLSVYGTVQFSEVFIFVKGGPIEYCHQNGLEAASLVASN